MDVLQDLYIGKSWLSGLDFRKVPHQMLYPSRAEDIAFASLFLRQSHYVAAINEPSGKLGLCAR
jgi:hypothetical protein